MNDIVPIEVTFPAYKTGLNTVYYQLRQYVNGAWANLGSPVSGSTITEQSAGHYVAGSIAVPDGVIWGVYWNTGDSSPLDAFESFNVATNPGLQCVVATVTSNQQFTATPQSGSFPTAANFAGCVVGFTTGLNRGVWQRIPTYTAASNSFYFDNPWPNTVAIGDQFQVLSGPNT